MLVSNHTPFAHVAFERRTARDAPLAVVVLQATFEIVDAARTTQAAQEQRMLQMLDEAPPVLLGSVLRETGGIRQEGALATTKPATDVHVDAVARAPEGRPRTEWPVKVRVGRVESALLARGPHVHTHGVLGWSTSDPAPCVEVPITVERAFGGTFRFGERIVQEARNPLGTGFLPREAPTDRPVPGAQVVALDDPFPLPREGATPRGWGPLGPDVSTRLQHAGTYDDAWLRERWPLPPDDLDPRFHQSAHPDLRAQGYLRGDEEVELVHVHEEPVLRFALPGLVPWLLLKHTDLRYAKAPLHLDTVHLDVSAPAREEHRVVLTWRACLREPQGMLQAEIRVKGGHDGQ